MSLGGPCISSKILEIQVGFLDEFILKETIMSDLCICRIFRLIFIELFYE